MHVMMLSLMIALAVCLLLLIGFGLFTRSAAAQRIGGPRAIETRR
jgi:septation ring formation regulator EzrA